MPCEFLENEQGSDIRVEFSQFNEALLVNREVIKVLLKCNCGHKENSVLEHQIVIFGLQIN